MLDLFTVNKLIDLWLQEDIGHGDMTALSMIDADQTAEFNMNAREDLYLAGIDVAAACFKRYDPNIKVNVKTRDATKCKAKTVLMHVSGPARALLTVERTALNITQHLSGIATDTARWMDLIKGTRAKLIDTRKSTPGLRMLEKHAVVCGGGANHRLGLDGGVMIKDNHIAVAGSIKKAVERARSHIPGLLKIEVECDRLEQVHEAIDAKADIIMLDNMSLEKMREAVKFVAGRVPLEASGGIRLDTVRPIAETGVDYISTSKTIQGAAAVDIGMDDV